MIHSRTHTARSGSHDCLQQSRSAFTIIELLIVVGILLLLTTFTVVSIDFAFESERVNSGARQVQSLITGARDRAIRYRKPVGVRFLVDQDADNGRMVSSMVYVSAADYWNLGNITLKRPDANNDGVADSDTVLVVDGDPETRWNKLRLRGFLGIYEDRNGNGSLDSGEDLNGNGVLDLETPRIKIPGDKNGTWYRVRTHQLGNPSLPPNLRNRLILVNEFRDPGTTPPSEVIAFEGTGHSTYLLELPPRVLPDAEPVLLPDNVVIDLDASEIPASWRPGGGAGYSIPCSNRMDLMFSPRGTITGTPAGLGMLHFYVCKRTDVQLAMDAGRGAVNGSEQPRVPSDALFASIPASQNPPPVGDRALVSVSTATGKVASYPIDPTDLVNNTNGAAGADGRLDDPFVYAERGEALSK